jgi:TonB family protein
MVQSNVDETAGLTFLLPRSQPASIGRIFRNAAASIAVHLFLALIAMSLPEVTRPVEAPRIVPDVRKAVKLVAPRFTDLTQKDPNRGKVSHSLDVRSTNSTPVPRAPRILPPAIPPGPPAPVPAPPPAPVIEPPKIEIAAAGSLEGAGTATARLTPPAPDKPKLAFESVTSAAVRSASNTPAISLPKPSVQELARAAARPAAGGGGGVAVGDDLDQPPSIGSFGQAPSPGKMGSNLQLLSDPAGVDFKPYLIQVLSAVRRNWMAVIPESARFGRRGVVTIQFIVDREGKVPKLVIASPSGTDAFDRAAVAGVSMSHPFPPLPANYKGDEIRLQLAFSYNVSR